MTADIAAGTTDSGSGEEAAPDTSGIAGPTTEETEMSEEVKYIALTFDDGPNSTTTNEVIDKLEKYGIVASFFLVGNNIDDESAKAVKRAYDLGCEIDNHSRTHSNMTELSAEEIKAEYDYTDGKVYEITGEHTKFFRPPYIAVHQIMFDNIDVPFIAGIGANDWEDRVTAEMRARMILKQAKDGDHNPASRRRGQLHDRGGAGHHHSGTSEAGIQVRDGDRAVQGKGNRAGHGEGLHQRNAEESVQLIQ